MLKRLGCSCVLMLALAACQRDTTLDDNRSPLANAGADQTLDYNGEPVSVRLDGSKSRDLDGKIVGYDWRLVKPNPNVHSDAGKSAAGDAGDAGGATEESQTIDPANVVKPKLTLDQGKYEFMLWVRDDRGAISEPDTVTIRVGADPVAECSAGAYEMLDDSCRMCLCSESDTCQTAIPACNADCWGLISCIAVKCPNYSKDMDVSCITANCVQFLAGQGGAMSAGSCVSPCGMQCTDSIKKIAGVGM